jgi:L-alanine-DL-glutamate epimerase-like enolase superfamily enzyme
MKITRVETIPIRVPLNPQLAIKSGRGGSHTVSPFLIVKLHTDEGLVGLGEVSCTPRWSGEDQVSANHFIQTYFTPALIGRDPTQIDTLSANVFQHVAGNYFTKAGVEMALWDLAGKAANKPLYELLGGKVRESVMTKWSVSGQPPERAAEIASWAIAQGFPKMKVKVGLTVGEASVIDSDFARVSAVRKVVGDNFNLGVDANGGWQTPDSAIAAIKRLLELNIYFAEQPVPAGDPAEMAKVRSSVSSFRIHNSEFSIIADESLYTLADAKLLARERAADVFSIYIGKAGGIAPARAIADFALSQKIPCTLGSNLELGVGSAAMTHLALAHKAFTPENFPCDIIGPFYYDDDIVAEPLPTTPGFARANAKPGLGIDLDDRKIAKYRVS